MSSHFEGLTPATLNALADCLESGRLGHPFSSHAIRRMVSVTDADNLAAELDRITSAGMTPVHTAYLLRAIAQERESGIKSGHVELVWTGPETPGSQSRETSVVVRELFTRAQTSILLAGFAITHGKHIFRELSVRMDQSPKLAVRLFLNVSRPDGDESSVAQVVREFGETFVHHHWPGKRLPVVFYDPRALEQAGPSVALHAKCVVIDGLETLITSANFTAAGHERNIEVGVLIRNPGLAGALSVQFDSLIESGMLRRIPGL